MSLRVTLDACVLYPTVMRTLLAGAAEAGLFEPRWSARILEEWARASARHGPEAEAHERGQGALLNARFPRAMTPAAPDLERRLWLPDPHDIHVLATAVTSDSDVIVTMNRQDFPQNVLAEEGLSRADPDGFLLGLAEAAPGVIAGLVADVVARLHRDTGEAMTQRQVMKRARLPRLGKYLERQGACYPGSDAV